MLKMFVQTLKLSGQYKYLSKLYDKLDIRLSHDGKWSILGQPIKRVDDTPLQSPRTWNIKHIFVIVKSHYLKYTVMASFILVMIRLFQIPL